MRFWCFWNQDLEKVEEERQEITQQVTLGERKVEGEKRAFFWFPFLCFLALFGLSSAFKYEVWHPWQGIVIDAVEEERGPQGLQHPQHLHCVRENVMKRAMEGSYKGQWESSQDGAHQPTIGHRRRTSALRNKTPIIQSIAAFFCSKKKIKIHCCFLLLLLLLVFFGIIYIYLKLLDKVDITSITYVAKYDYFRIKNKKNS